MLSITWTGLPGQSKDAGNTHFPKVPPLPWPRMEDSKAGFGSFSAVHGTVDPKESA